MQVGQAMPSGDEFAPDYFHRHHLLILKEYFGNLYDFPLSTPYKLNAVERFGKMLGMVGLASIGNALY